MNFNAAADTDFVMFSCFVFLLIYLFIYLQLSDLDNYSVLVCVCVATSKWKARVSVSCHRLAPDRHGDRKKLAKVKQKQRKKRAQK